jgi:hypothetical protein
VNNFANLDVVALVVVAAFSKQPMVHHTMNVQLIEKGITVLSSISWLLSFVWNDTYFRHRRGEDNDLIKLTNALHELINPRPFNDIDIVVLSFNFHRDGEVGPSENLPFVSMLCRWMHS